jgi:hypothetical protein
MILPALAAAALAFQPAPGARLPYAPVVSVSYVHVTATSAASCGVVINGVAQRGDDCAFAPGAAEGLRRLGRDAALVMLFSSTPDGARPPTGIEAGELIMERRARLEIARDGSIAHCEPGIARVIREVAGIQHPLDFCALYPIGQRAFPAARGGAPRAVEMAALVFLREGAPR